jgi:ATP-dependent Lon protease
LTLKDYGEFPLNIPVIIEDSDFIYPFMIVPIFLNSDENVLAIDESIEKDLPIFIAFTNIGKEGSRDLEDCYNVGVIGSIMRRVSLPDGRTKVLFQGLSRGRMLNASFDGELYTGTVEAIESLPFEKFKVNAGMIF